MTRAAERVCHRLIRADQHVRTAPHVARNQDGLADGLIRRRHAGMLRRKRPRRALAVNAELALFAVNQVRLELGDIVRDIVNQVHLQFARRFLQDMFKRFAHPMRDDLPVGKGVIRGAGHR